MSLSHDVTLDETAQNTLALALLRIMDLDIAASSGVDAQRRISERNKLVEALGNVVPVSGRTYSPALNGETVNQLQRSCSLTNPVHASMVLSEVMLTNPWSSEKLNPDVKRIGMKELASFLRFPIPDTNVDVILNQYLPKQRNFKRIALITLFSVAGGLIAAPHVGAAIGAAMGLSGAAATSAGLAALGFGSVAAGGFGMAGGTLVVGVLAGVVGGGTTLKAASSHIKSNPELEALKLKVSLYLMNLLPEAHATRQEIIQTIENGIKNAQGNLTSCEKQVESLVQKLHELKKSDQRWAAETPSIKSKIKDLRKNKIKELEEEIELLKSSLP
jgi:hypothetical protein